MYNTLETPRRAFGIGILVIALLVGIGSLLASARTQASSPAIGSMAPSFRLQDQAGAWHQLSDYAGKWVVLYFYPKDQTPGCTTQACDLRDNIFAFRKLSATILGVSDDDVASHKEFAEKHTLPFTLLADSTKKTATDYGVLVKMMGVFELAQRDTFIIDPEGRIAEHWANVEPKGHSEMVLKALEALQAKAAASKK
jgi:peroxiredoxin Q/BCP